MTLEVVTTDHPGGTASSQSERKRQEIDSLLDPNGLLSSVV